MNPNKLAWLIISCWFCLVSCGARAPEMEPQLNTPYYYYATGMRFYEAGRYEQALEEFKLAQKLNPKYGHAYYGLGLVYGQKGDFVQAFSNMEQAKRRNGALARVGLIRLYTLQKGDGWLDKAKKEFEEGTKEDPQNPSIHFYMGKAYKEAYQFDQAEVLFSRVRGSPSAYSARAEKEREDLSRIRQANPETPLGRDLALREKISRAELAGLLVEELKNLAYCPEADKNFKLFATDIEKHSLRKYVEKIIPCNLRGLDVSPALIFEPDRPVTRMEIALLSADLRKRELKKDETVLAHGGKIRSYTDVPPQHYAYNAIIMVTALGIMGPVEQTKKEFRPQDPISGSEAVLALKTVQKQLKGRE